MHVCSLGNRPVYACSGLMVVKRDVFKQPSVLVKTLIGRQKRHSQLCLVQEGILLLSGHAGIFDTNTIIR